MKTYSSSMRVLIDWISFSSTNLTAEFAADYKQYVFLAQSNQANKNLRCYLLGEHTYLASTAVGSGDFFVYTPTLINK